MNDGRLRLFFGLWPRPETAEALAQWAAPIARASRGRVTRAETIHLTLAFLGDVPEARLDDATRAARSVAFHPFRFRLDEARYWKHNRILWAGAGEVPGALPDLAASLAAALRGEGFTLEERSFVAHVTLARRGDRPAEIPALPPLDWPVREFVLVRSQPSAGGSNYAVLGRFPAR